MDTVSVVRRHTGERPEGKPADLFVNLGKGDDTFLLRTETDGTTASQGEDRPVVRVEGGEGNDLVRIDYSGNPASIRKFEPNDDVEVNLGQGDDTFSIQLPVSLTTESTGGPHSRLTVNVDGGAGNDTFQTSVNGVLIDDPNLRPAVHVATSLNYDGGEGDDTFDTSFLGVDLNTASSFEMNGGAGRDSFVTAFRGVTINAPMELAQSGGAGIDDIRVIYDFNPQPDPPARPGLEVNAPLSINLSGGGGNDDIRVISGFNPQPDPSAAPLLVLNSRMTVRLEGGGGNDAMFGEIIPCIEPSGSLNVTMDGGAGDDVVIAAILVDLDSDPNHTITCRVLGGDGNDTLALAAVDSFGSSLRTHYLIDGGDGTDMVLVATPNVLVRNCER